MPENTSGAVSFGQYWQAICRHRRSMFITFVTTWATFCALAWLLPARYRSDATILMEKPKVPKQYVVPNVESDPQAQLEKLTQEILSRTRLQRIIDDFHLYSGFLARLGVGGVDRMRKDIRIDQVLTNSKPPELAGFTISYSGDNPQLAQNVTARLASLFIEEDLRTRENQSASTTAFLDRQMQEARVDVEEQTKRLKRFKAQFVGQLPGELQSNLQVLNGLQIRLQQSSQSLNRSEEQKLYLTSMLNSYRDSPYLATTGGSSVDLDSQLARLKEELAELQSRYTSDHPAILQIRDQIAKVRKLRTESQADETSDDTGLPVSRVVAEIRSQLKEAELDIQNRTKEIASIQSEMRTYENQLKEMPLREQQLAELTQEYNQSRQNYEDLLGKKNDSALATDMERAQQGEQFTLLDPPGWPVSPYFPNRLLTTLGGLGAGLMAALACAFIRESSDDHIHADIEVSKLSNIPILVTIPPLITAREETGARRRAIGEITCATAALILVTTSAVVAYVYG